MSSILSTYKPLLLLLLLRGSTACDLPEHYFAEVPVCQQTPEGVEGDSLLSDKNQRVFRELLKNQSPKDYRYFFRTFLEAEPWLVVEFRSDSLCFPIKLRVEKWDKLGGMRRTNGRSYPRELYDLRWTIESRNGREVVLYQDMHRIID